MKLFGSDANSGSNQTSNWFGMNFNPKLSPGWGMLTEQGTLWKSYGTISGRNCYKTVL